MRDGFSLTIPPSSPPVLGDQKSPRVETLPPARTEAAPRAPLRLHSPPAARCARAGTFPADDAGRAGCVCIFSVMSTCGGRVSVRWGKAESCFYLWYRYLFPTAGIKKSLELKRGGKKMTTGSWEWKSPTSVSIDVYCGVEPVFHFDYHHIKSKHRANHEPKKKT